ncbi:MAG: trigger factor [Dermatophilaceae bacterium]
MKSARETLGPTRVKLTVEVPFDELKPSLDAAYQTIGNQIQVPGFRRGKVPSRIIDQRLGKGAVLQEAVNEALPQFYGQALQEHDVRPLGQPEVDVSEVPLEDGQALKFSAEVDCRPEIVLPDYAGLAVTVEPISVSDEDVSERLESLRERFGTLKAIDRAAENGDFVTIDLSAQIDGEPVDSVTGVSYEVGSENMLDGLDEVLVGATAGETRTFTSALAGGEHEGQQADCTVTVQSVKERELPTLDDEFAQLASEFDTLAELRADLTKDVERAKRFGQGVEARDKLVDALVGAVDIAVPESIIEQEVTSHLEGEQRLDDAEHRAEVESSSRQAFKVQMLLDAVVEKEEIQVEQAELIEYLVMTAQQYGMEPNEFARAIDGQSQIPEMIAEVARRKALAWIMEQATVTDTDGNHVDLTTLAAPGEPEGDTAAEAEAQDETSVEPEAAPAETSVEPEAAPAEATTEVEAAPGEAEADAHSGS